MNLRQCDLCPRHCGIDRLSGQVGYCGAGGTVQVSNVMLHHWEEPCISGYGGDKDPRGSGAVFFVHCNLGCVYCQNRTISRRDSRLGRPMLPEELAEVFLGLQRDGAYNLNLVTPTHYAAQIAGALRIAKTRGLTLPIIWNTGGYESVAVLDELAGLVDIYLTDFKYASPALAEALSAAPDYPTAASAALRTMVRQVGPVVFDESGMLRRGVILRHLVLPGQRKDSMKVLRLAAEAVHPADVRISLMRQYTPDFLTETGDFLTETGDFLTETGDFLTETGDFLTETGDFLTETGDFLKETGDFLKETGDFLTETGIEKPTIEIPKALLRRVTAFEYQSVVDEAVRLGFDGYTQEKESAVKNFTPAFR